VVIFLNLKLNIIYLNLIF